MMSGLAGDMAGFAKATFRVLKMDPLAIAGILPIRSARARLAYYAELDAWHLRLMAVSGKDRAEVERAVKTLPVNSEGYSDLDDIRRRYESLCAGASWGMVFPITINEAG